MEEMEASTEAIEEQIHHHAHKSHENHESAFSVLRWGAGGTSNTMHAWS